MRKNPKNQQTKSPQMERFLEFFGGIWEKVHRILNTMEMPWI